MPAPEEDQEWTDEQIAEGGRLVITSFMPTLTGYEDIVRSQLGPTRELNLELPPVLVRLAASSAGTDRVDDPYYRSHLQYLQNLCLVVKRGGSVMAAGQVGRAAIRTSQEMPAALLRHLDADVRQFAEQANRGELGLVVPPLLATVIARAGGRRDRIVDAVGELREEWSEPRRRVWETLHALRCTRDFEEANGLMHELDEISTVIRAPGVPFLRPMEMAWQVTTVACAGALATWIASGNPLLGAAVPAAGRAIAAVGSLGYRLFGLGGFGLARSIRRAVQDYKPSVDQLSDFLSDNEKRHLGL